MSAYPSYTRIFVAPPIRKRIVRLAAADDAVTEVSPPRFENDTLPSEPDVAIVSSRTQPYIREVVTSVSRTRVHAAPNRAFAPAVVARPEVTGVSQTWLQVAPYPPHTRSRSRPRVVQTAPRESGIQLVDRPSRATWALGLWFFFPPLLALGGSAFAQRYLAYTACSVVSFVVAMTISRWRERRR